MNDVQPGDWIWRLLDDATDRRELEAARAEDDYLPWDEAKAALGLN